MDAPVEVQEGKNRLDIRSRREIADEVWRIFGLMMADRIALTFEAEGITIRIPFKEEVDLAGPEFVTGSTTGYRQYEELEFYQRGKRPI